MNQNQPLLHLNNISVHIQSNQQTLELVNNIDITIEHDDMISLIGPNGAGKSTLVKVMLGLIKPSIGTINKQHKLIIGYVPQKFTVDNSLPLRVIDLLNQAIQNRLSDDEKQQLFDQLSLCHLLYQPLIHLSGGETQRVLLARALLEKPQLLILDEPMQGLDPDSETLLYQFIDNLPSFVRCAMLVVSHDLHWVMKGSRHVICLNKHICCQGKPIDIQNESEFQKLFGSGYAHFVNNHQFEQPYIHSYDSCQHSCQNDCRNADNTSDQG